jgi:hypothetical protein
MVSLVSEPSLRVCDCGKVYRLQACDASIEEADLRRHGIAGDCPDCIGTGIGYPPPDALCSRCRGRGYLLVEEE